MRRDFLIGSCFLERTHLWLSNFRSHLLGRWVYWSTKKNVNIDLCHCKSQRANLWEVSSFCVATGIQQPLDTINLSTYRHLYSRTLTESGWDSVEYSAEQCYSQIRCADPTPHWNMRSHWTLPPSPVLQSYSPLNPSNPFHTGSSDQPSHVWCGFIRISHFFFPWCFKHQTIGIIKRKQFTKTECAQKTRDLTIKRPKIPSTLLYEPLPPPPRFDPYSL